MSFYLGVWSSDRAISDQEAADFYSELFEGRWVPTEFNADVYAFYSQLIKRFPDVDLVPDEEIDTCAWSCALDVSGRHVIMAMQDDKSALVIPFVVDLAHKHGLVCFDPQAGKAYLPAHLEIRRAACG